MNGYVEGGYLVTGIALGGYTLSLLRRERRQRHTGTIPGAPRDAREPAPVLPETPDPAAAGPLPGEGS
jgi:hypothetical protein